MATRVMRDYDSDRAALYDGTTETAFGPVFHSNIAQDAGEVAEAFIDYVRANVGKDPFRLTREELDHIYGLFLERQKAVV